MAYIPNSNSVVGFQSQPSSLLVGASVIGLTPVNVTNMPSPSVIAYQLAGSLLGVSGTFNGGNSSVQLLNSVAVIGSVATLQGTNPWVISNPSVTAYQGGTWATSIVGVAQIGGSVLVHTANNSVITILTNSSVTALQGTNPWQVNVPTPSYITYQLAGSVLAVSGSFSASPQSSINALQLAGSVQAVRTDNASVVTVDGTFTKMTSVMNTNPSSLMVGASIFGTVPVTQVTSPWVVNMPSPSVITYQLAGSLLAVSGSFSGGNTSVQLLGSNAVIGSVAVLQGTDPWKVNVPTPSYISYQAAGSILAVSGISFTATSVTGTMSVLGTVPVTEAGAWVVSVYGAYQEKNAVTASVIGVPVLFKIDETNSVLSAVSPQSPLPVKGSITTLQGTNPWQVNMPSPSVVVIHPAGSVVQVRTDNASVVAVLSNSSVTALQGTNPWVVSVPTPSYLSIQPAGSVLNVNVSGSVAAIVGNNIGSIVGTYAEDAASNNNDKGIFTLGVRNDTLASLVSASGDYTGWGTDSAGRHLVKPFISEDGTIISYTGSIVSTSVTLIQASVTGLRNYITDFWLSNTGATTTLVYFKDGSTSILGHGIAPTGGGESSPGIAIPIKTAPGQDLVFAPLSATSVLYVTVKGYQAP